MSPPAAASVVVPTIGRAAKVRNCLESLVTCQPPPAEIIVVDQSGDSAVAEVVASYDEALVHLVRSGGRGAASATNSGARAASQPLLLRTDDDCVVRDDWVRRAEELLSSEPDALFTGRVLPSDGASGVPSTIDDDTPREYFREMHVGKLFSGNMAVSRTAFLEFGGFDERFMTAAEDNDLCWRWLSAGRRIRYDPELVVWHEDWRTRSELEALYVSYARAQGMLYAKYLLAGDRRILRFLVSDLRLGVAGILDHHRRGRPPWTDWRQGILRGTPVGLLQGLRQFTRPGPRRSTGRT